MAALEVYRGSFGMVRFVRDAAEQLASLPARWSVSRSPRTAEELLSAEQEYRREALAMADLRIARDIVEAHLDEDLVRTAVADGAAGSRAWAG
jgi:hypothetical protein